MTSNATTPDEYINNLPEDRKNAILKIRKVISKNLPKGFEAGIGYGMLSYHVPFSMYPNGYHCKPELPLPFMNLASQKNFIALYHMGLYAKKELLDWFVTEYPKHCKRKLDMGKSCIRFKKIEEIPYQLIGELVSKMSPTEWIAVYENVQKK